MAKPVIGKRLKKKEKLRVSKVLRREESARTTPAMEKIHLCAAA